MAHVDLHLHTTYSDGTLTPEELVATAAERDVKLIAVTDHDEIDGVPPAQRAGTVHGVTVISGVEINTEVGREDIHILGYGYPVGSPILHEGLVARRASRVERIQFMVQRLDTLGCPVSMDRVLAIAGHGSVGRPHLARALVEMGCVSTVDEAFSRLIGNRSPAYVPRQPFLPEQAIELIHRAGGITSLAHPGKLGDPVRIIRQLVLAGLDALEVYHSDHPLGVIERMHALAKRFHLLETGGSDSHGPSGPRHLPVGAVPVPDDVGEKLLSFLAEKRQQRMA